jgi:hypothetical protein
MGRYAPHIPEQEWAGRLTLFRLGIGLEPEDAALQRFLVAYVTCLICLALPRDETATLLLLPHQSLTGSL